MSLKKQLNEYIDTYVSRSELRSFGNLKGYDVANTDRQLRSLTEDGEIKPRFEGKYIVGYFKGSNQSSIWQ